MWVEETPNGKYKYIERYKDPMTGRDARKSVTLDKNTKQAWKQAQKELSEKIRRALLASSGKITLKDLVDRYRADLRVTVKENTYNRNYFATKSLMRILGSDTLANQINAGYVRERFLSTGDGPGTLNERLTRFRSLMRWGYKNDLVEDISYLDKLENFPDIPHREKIQDKFLEADEAKDLIKEMSVEIWRDLTEFMVLSGLRFGEAAALLRSDIDLKDRLIHVAKSYDVVDGIVTTTKTETSTRDVYIQDELFPLCRKLVAQSMADTIISINAGSLLFSGKNGGHIAYYAYNKYLKENSRRVIGRAITTHTLRHTHASLLMEQGVDENVISRRLGHKNSKITKEIYLHVTNKLKQKDYDQVRQIKIL